MDNLKSHSMQEHILMYWGMDNANAMENEETITTEKDYCESFGFNWAEWYQLRRELYDRGDVESIFGNH